jgi:large subunit ribosomal protein L26e
LKLDRDRKRILDRRSKSKLSTKGKHTEESIQQTTTTTTQMETSS